MARMVARAVMNAACMQVNNSDHIEEVVKRPADADVDPLKIGNPAWAIIRRRVADGNLRQEVVVGNTCLVREASVKYLSRRESSVEGSMLWGKRCGEVLPSPSVQSYWLTAAVARFLGCTPGLLIVGLVLFYRIVSVCMIKDYALVSMVKSAERKVDIDFVDHQSTQGAERSQTLDHLILVITAVGPIVAACFIHGLRKVTQPAPFSKADVGKVVRITGNDVHVNGKARNINWLDAKHHDLTAKIKSVEEMYRGKVELQDGQEFENGEFHGQLSRLGAGTSTIDAGKARSKASLVGEFLLRHPGRDIARRGMVHLHRHQRMAGLQRQRLQSARLER